jgi:hypothetical protein
MFLNNTVVGGAFPVGGGASSYFSDVTFERCCFAGNSAELGGGGMYLEGGTNLIVSCAILDNHTTGAEVGWGGGILNSFAAHANVVNCLIAGNTAQRGGGYHNTVFTSADLTNCTIVDNTATAEVAASGGGGGIYCNTDTESSVANCIVWNNVPDQIESLSPMLDVRYCDVQGGHAGAGNVNAPPLFVDADGVDDDPSTYVDNDYRLAANSPCVDAGDTTALPESVAVDLDAAPRVMNVSTAPDTGVPLTPGGSIVDMGAYEVQPAPLCPADVSPPGAPDGQVNIDDLLLIVNNWGTSNADADVDDNGIVDIDDLLAIINAWGPC